MSEPPHVRRMFGLTLDEVLAQALDSAFAVDDPEQRADLVEQVAHTAVQHGRPDLASEVLIDLPERSVRALLHVRMAEHFARRGDRPRALHHLDQARAETEAPDRWMPRTGWLTADSAREELVRLLAELAEDDKARAILAALPPGSLALARARLAWACARPDRRWDEGLDAVRAIPDPEDRRLLLGRLVEAAAAAGLEEPIEALVAGIAERAWGLDPAQQQVLVERAAEALAETGLTEAAGRCWARAAASLAAADAMTATTGLCRIADTQARFVGTTPALETLTSAVDRIAHEVLPPDPGDRYPWRPLYRTVWANGALAEPLRAVLRTRRSLAPAWCFVLGELELLAEQADRAVRAAAALEAAYAADTTDIEPLWLAALLYAHAGDLDHAVPAMRGVLAQLEPGHKVRLPGDEDEAAYIETHFASALLQAEAVGAAVDLARLAPHGELRASVLHRAAKVAARQGDHALALDLVEEAADTLVAAAEDGPGSARSLGVLPGELARLAWSLGHEDVAVQIVEDAIAATREVSGPLAVNLLCDLEARAVAARALPLVNLLREEGARRVATAAPAERCELLLVVAEAAVATTRR